jgi:hypothetical protein
MNLNIYIATWCIKQANTLLNAFPIKSKLLVFITFLVLANLYIATTKLRCFINPKYPKSSLIIQETASTLNAISHILIIVTLIYIFILFILVFFALSLNDSLGTNSFLEVIAHTLKQLWTAMHQIMLPLIGGALLGVVSGVYLKYILIPEWGKGEGLNDVNNIANKFSKLDGFNPTRYIDVKKGCFLGASVEKKLIYIPWQKIRETHIQVIGSTGGGKGRVMSLIAYQSILSGEGLIWFDPKFDRFSPRIVENAAKQAGKNFYFINLNPDQPPQLNPLGNATAYEIEELLVTSFDLKAKGTDGDYHRGKDEDAAIKASKLAVANNALSIPELIRVCRLEESITTQENFWRKLTKLGDLNVINTNGGLNLEDAILNGAAIYIVGSTDNERVKMLQKLLLVRINQIIKKRDRLKQNTPTCIILDEFKYLLSPTALSGLGVIRDFNAHCLLAHQSLGDLDSCHGITRAEAEGVVLDNTAIKIVYKIGDSNYAEKLSKNSGKKRVFVEQSGKGTDENNQHHGSWQETNLPLIDPDLITHLPMPSDRKDQATVGVIFGAGVSRVFFTGPLPASGIMPKVKAAPKFNDQSEINAQGGFDDLI